MTLFPGCADPAAVTGASVVTSGPYANASTAVFQCASGYIVSIDIEPQLRLCCVNRLHNLQ